MLMAGGEGDQWQHHQGGKWISWHVRIFHLWSFKFHELSISDIGDGQPQRQLGRLGKYPIHGPAKPCFFFSNKMGVKPVKASLKVRDGQSISNWSIRLSFCENPLAFIKGCWIFSWYDAWVFFCKSLTCLFTGKDWKLLCLKFKVHSPKNNMVANIQ